MAKIIASVVTGSASSLNSVHNLNGFEDKSTLEIVSVIMLVPNLADCFLILSISSLPLNDSGNPGKFSISVVVVNWPPAAIPLAIIPSYNVGFISALAKYIAAVWAAGPEPMIVTL